MKNCRPMLNQRGFSLVEIMVAFALLGLLTYFMMDMLRHQHTEAQFVANKLMSLDIKRQLQASFDGPSFCGCLMRGRTFRANQPNANNNFSPAINRIPTHYNTPIPPPPASCSPSASSIVPVAGQTIEGTQLKVAGISYESVVNAGSGVFNGELKVDFEKDGNKRLVNSISVPFTITVDTTSGSPSSRPISSCGVSLAEEKYLAFFNPALINSGPHVDTGNQVCRASQVAIHYGGHFVTDHNYDNRGHYILQVNGTDVSYRQGGGRAGGGELTNAPDTVHGVYILPCSGTVRARTRWTLVNDSPRFEHGFIELRFFD